MSARPPKSQAPSESERREVIDPGKFVVPGQTGTRRAHEKDEPSTRTKDSLKSILIIEDNPADSDRCRAVLHELGHDGIQVLNNLPQAEGFLDDVLNNLTYPPDAIVLDLGLGYESGFGLLRKCHANPELAKVPILVWCKCAEEHTQALSMRLGVKDFLVKSPDKEELRATLERLLAPKADGKTTRSVRD